MSWKARKMVPGKDTIRVMATHYGLKPSQLRAIIQKANVPVIREDGFKGTLTRKLVKDPFSGPYGKMVPGWSDGQAGFDPDTTVLTRPAIDAVVAWVVRRSSDNGEDS